MSHIQNIPQSLQADAYVFLTYGAVAERYPVGLAVQGVTCHPNKRFRTSISRYYDPQAWKSADAYTAEVQSKITNSWYH